MQFVDRMVKRTSFQLVCRDLSIKIYTFTVACIFVRKGKRTMGDFMRPDRYEERSMHMRGTCE